jgi:phosphatidylethanolamine/phosphatidyl-N-methylethanolamine N-methyltransferase
MDLDKIRERYLKHYAEVQYSGTGARATNFYHGLMEAEFKGYFYHDVLEVGAGSGEHLSFVRHDFRNYYLTDHVRPSISPRLEALISKYRIQKKLVHIQTQDVQNLTFSSETFDRVIATCLFHHLPFPAKALEELRRVTKAGGILTLYLPADPGLLYRFSQFFVTTLSLKKYFSKAEIRYLRASEHRNHIESITGLINGIFANDLIKKRSFPRLNIGWNTRLFEIYSIQIQR